MFGALNRFIGRLDGEPPQQSRNGPNDNAFGFQVLRNKDPELPLEPWFDFIVGINGHIIVSYYFFWTDNNEIADRALSTGGPGSEPVYDRSAQLRGNQSASRSVERKGTT